jgi:hypothetical protein
MEDIITFTKLSKNGDSTICFGFFYQGNFVVKGYREEHKSVSFNFWEKRQDRLNLLQHIEYYFTKSGLQYHSLYNPIEYTSELGTYYPRVYRIGLNYFDGTNVTRFRNFKPEVLNQSIISTRLLLIKLKKVFEFVSFDIRNFSCFGHEIRSLLLLACMEVESSWNGILSSNGYVTTRRTNTTQDYVKLKSPLKLCEYQVEFKLYPQIPTVNPFGTWDAGSPTQSLSWYDTYNKTKHDRENNDHLANLESVIHSIAGALVMLYVQFGPDEMFWTDSEFADFQINTPKFIPTDFYIPLPAHGEPIWNEGKLQL